MSHALDPFASQRPGEYRHGDLRVRRAVPARPDGAGGGTCTADGGVRDADGIPTAHFAVRHTASGIDVTHSLSAAELDNDLAGLLADELFTPGLLPDPALFEPVFTGVVLSAAPDAMTAWRSFYTNTLRTIRRCWRRPSDAPNASRIANIAPVYAEGLRQVPEGSVLDIGSCFGFFPLLLAERRHRRVVASDITPGSARLLAGVAREAALPLRTLACDATALPLPRDAVGTVTVLHLLEHLTETQGFAVLREALRVATDRVVIAVPFEDVPDPTYGHIRRFDTTTLSALGTSTGRPFTVTEHHGGWLTILATNG